MDGDRRYVDGWRPGRRLCTVEALRTTVRERDGERRRRPGERRIWRLAATDNWRGRRVEVRVARAAVEPGDRFILVDDWIETGSQAMTVRRLVERLSGHLIGVSVVVDDAPADIRESLTVVGLIASSELPGSA